jgi:hypothetical protein
MDPSSLLGSVTPFFPFGRLPQPAENLRSYRRVQGFIFLSRKSVRNNWHISAMTWEARVGTDTLGLIWTFSRFTRQAVVFYPPQAHTFIPIG